MTVKERLISVLGFAPANANTVDGELLDAGISDGDIEYVPDDHKSTVIEAAIKIIEIILSTADTRNENGYGITYDRAALLNRLKFLKAEIGVLDDSMPFIRGPKVW